MGVLHAVVLTIRSIIHALSRTRQAPEERKTVTEPKITRQQVYREQAVRNLAAMVMRAPIGSLDYREVNDELQKQFELHGHGDTRIAFIDQVLAQMTLPHWHAADDHVEWFTRNFIGSREPVSAG